MDWRFNSADSYNLDLSIYGFQCHHKSINDQQNEGIFLEYWYYYYNYKYSRDVEFLQLFNIQGTGRPPTISYMLGFCLKIMFQILFQTLFLFMILWMTLVHDRWKNYRDFLSRTYTPQSVIYLSGFVIFIGFMATTYGRGLNTLMKLFKKSVNTKLGSRSIRVVIVRFRLETFEPAQISLTNPRSSYIIDS